MLLIDTKSRVPIYEQLKNRTLELINAGVLKVDEKMPSVRALATNLGVNPNTIQKAYQDMEKDGIIYTVAGRGSFVAKKENLNQQVIDNAVKQLGKSAYNAKIYGITLKNALNIVQNIYEKDGEPND